VHYPPLKIAFLVAVVRAINIPVNKKKESRREKIKEKEK